MSSVYNSGYANTNSTSTNALPSKLIMGNGDVTNFEELKKYEIFFLWSDYLLLEINKSINNVITEHFKDKNLFVQTPHASTKPD